MLIANIVLSHYLACIFICIHAKIENHDLMIYIRTTKLFGLYLIYLSLISILIKLIQ